jgi:hypothetical protein
MLNLSPPLRSFVKVLVQISESLHLVLGRKSVSLSEVTTIVTSNQVVKPVRPAFSFWHYVVNIAVTR